MPAAATEKPKMTKEEREQIKRDRFLKLGAKRTRKALKALESLGKCGNKNSYSYTDDEASKVKDAISNAVADLLDSFSGKAKLKQEEFDF